MKAMPRALPATLLVSFLVAPGTTPAQGPAPSAEQAAVRSAVDAFVAAFAARDSKAIAGLFTEQGEAIDVSGEAVRGRAALEAHYAGRFEADPGEKIRCDVEVVHVLAPEVVRLDGRATLLRADGGTIGTTRFASTYLKGPSGWKIASLRELDDPGITPHDRLSELQWLVGDWIEETGDASIETSVAWSEDGNFLLRHFDVKVQGKSELKGTQRIGWDPVAKQFRSWVFDSKGGFGEGHWSRGGDRWVIKTTGVTPEALAISATQTLTRVGKDHLRWTSTGRTLGGEASGEDHEVMMVRKPPRPR